MKNYTKVIEKESRKAFFEKFTEKLYKELIRFFDKEEADAVIEHLVQNNIKIENVENFLFSHDSLQDGSIELRKKCKSLNDFVLNASVYFKDRMDRGDTFIRVREFFLVICDYLSKEPFEKKKEELRSIFTNFIINLSSNLRATPFIFEIPHYNTREELSEKTGLNLKNFKKIISLFSEVYLDIKNSESIKNIPRLKFIYPLFKDALTYQEDYLHNLFPEINKTDLSCILKCFPSLSMDTPQLRSVLESMSFEHSKETDVSKIIEELQKIENKSPLKTYPELCLLCNRKDKFSSGNPFYKLKGNGLIFRGFVEKASYYNTFQPYVCSVSVNCLRENLHNIHKYIESAKKLCLLKSYLFKGEIGSTSGLKITLTSIDKFGLPFLLDLKEQERKIRSITNKNFIFELAFYPDKCSSRNLIQDSEYIRIISDIHADYNAHKKYKFNFESDYVINCGDTAGNAKACIKWISNNMKRGLLVMGNHFGYSSAFPELDQKPSPLDISNNEPLLRHPKNSKSNQMLLLSKKYTRDEKLRFISNSKAELDNIIILGTTLYTDFALYGDEHIEESMYQAKHFINDFRLITVRGHRKYTRTPDGWKVKMVKREEGIPRLYTPEDHAYYFNFSFNFLKEKVEEYKDKKIIIATHFAPSPYSLDPKYAGSPLNPFFASNLNEFIINNPQIRLWAHGHCVDDSTEVLTVEGWKYFNQIKETDKVLNLNPMNNKIEEDRINGIISKLYTGNVYHFHSKGSDIRVTEDHDMLTIYRKTQKLTKIKAKDLYNKKQKFIIRAGVQEKEGINLSDNLLRLLVWMSADGNKPKESSDLVRFRLFKERKIKRLQELLNLLNIQYHIYYYYSNKTGGCSINFNLPQELQNLSFKPIDPIIAQCNKHQCSIILEEYANTDGVHNSNTIIIYTSKKEEADNIQLMCITNGYGCSISKRINHGFKLQSGAQKISYELNIINKPYRCIDNPHNTTTIEQVTDEHFWCLNTNNGTLIIRRNGKVNITGNCHNPCDYILGQTRVICCPFGYYNENNFELPDGYGKRILKEDIKSDKPWTELCKDKIEQGEIKIYTE